MDHIPEAGAASTPGAAQIHIHVRRLYRPTSARRCPPARVVKAAARGRWQKVLRALLGWPPQLLDGRGHPCPRCGGVDRFAAFRDFSLTGGVHCRKCHQHGADGLAALQHYGGMSFRDALCAVARCLGLLDGRAPLPVATASPSGHGTPATPAPTTIAADRRIEWDPILTSFAESGCDLRLLAAHLGVTATSLTRLQTGWSVRDQAWSFPMRDGSSLEVVGIRLRSRDGRKFAVLGSRDGIHVPLLLKGMSWDQCVLLVPEGPTDTAALLDLGFAAVGRPSAMGGRQHVVSFARRMRHQKVVVVADADPTGQDAAVRMASELIGHCLDVRIITPPAPHKDVRDWIRAGATHGDVADLIAAAAKT
jgi:phage/plasmid primase-like uncharacterized protein